MLVDHALELLAPLGAARERRMFGGHGLYVDDFFIALISGERLFLKADEQTRSHFQAAGGEAFVYSRSGEDNVTLGYWTVPPDALESPALMLPWARLALEAALRARAAKPAPARRQPMRKTPRAGPAHASPPPAPAAGPPRSPASQVASRRKPGSRGDR